MSGSPFILESQIKLAYKYSVGRWYGAFLTGLAEGRLVGSRCGGCGQVAVPARAACPLCSAASAGLVEVGPKGVVISAARDERGGKRAWLLVRPEGAATSLLTHGEALIGNRVIAEFAPEAGPSILALRGFRPL